MRKAVQMFKCSKKYIIYMNINKLSIKYNLEHLNTSNTSKKVFKRSKINQAI